MFRLPFVFAKAWGIEGIVPPMNLFKVFPRFGAMVLGQPLEQAQYKLEEARAASRLGEHERAMGLAAEITAELGDTHRLRR